MLLAGLKEYMYSRYAMRLKRMSVPFILLVLIGTLIISLFFFEQKIQREAQQSVDESLTFLLKNKKQHLSEYIQINSDFLFFLLDTPPIQGVSRALLNEGVDPVDGITVTRWKERLSTIFQSMMHTYTDIRQLRLIDSSDGDELVRVDRFGGIVKVQLEPKLQNKASKDYFTETLKLNERSLYISQLDLNKERGKIVHPIEPTLRFALPVYNDDNVLLTVLVLNLNAEELLQNLYSNVEPALQLLLLTQTGHFIYHFDEALRFSRDLSPDTTWQSLYSKEPWLHGGLSLVTLKKDEKQQFISKEGVLRTSSSDQHGLIKIMVAMPISTYTELLFEKRLSTYGLLVVLSLIFVIVLTIIWFYFKSSQKLIDTQSEFADIIDGASGGIIGFNTKLQITSFNRTAERFFPELARNIGIGYKILEPYVEQDFFHHVLNQVSKSQVISPLEVTLEREEEQVIDLEFTISPIRNANTTIKGFALFITDVTAQNKAKDKIKNNNALLEQQVTERTAELESAKKRAEEASNIKSSFISSISHEMRTPLNGILGTLNLVCRDVVSKQQKSYLDMMKTSAQTLTSLINDILDLSKIEAGKLELDSELFDPISLLEHVTSSIGVKAQEKQLDYQLDALDIEYLGLFGDASRLKQVLYNLLSNAIKFTEKGGVYVVAKTVTDSEYVWLEINVRDTGVGISRENYNKLFQAFSQESATITSQYGGTGLGLSICKQLCKLMGGDISFSSEKGFGSEFILRLPYPIESAKPLHVMPVLSGTRVYIESPSPEFVQFLEKLTTRFAGEVTHQDNADYWFIDASSSAMERHIIHPLASKRCCVFYDAMNCTVPANVRASVAKPIRYLDVLVLINKDKANIMFDLIEDNQPHPQEPEQYRALKGKVVMVVDDNQINLEVAKGMLVSQGIDVLMANSGIDLLEKLNVASAQSLEIMAILMDCNMPLMDGYEATSAVRAGKGTEHYRNIPIIAMTAGTMSGERERCLSIGMNNYITKPVNPDNLFSTLILYISDDIERGIESSTTFLEVLEDEQTLNIEDALERMQGDKSLYLMICELFLADVPTKFDEIALAIKNEAHEEIKHLAHAIRGQSGDVGAEKLFSLAVVLEEDACTQPTIAIYEATYNKMLEELIRVNKRIDSMRHVKAS